jgi:hypothetical protein
LVNLFDVLNYGLKNQVRGYFTGKVRGGLGFVSGGGPQNRGEGEIEERVLVGAANGAAPLQPILPPGPALDRHPERSEGSLIV